MASSGNGNLQGTLGQDGTGARRGAGGRGGNTRQWVHELLRARIIRLELEPGTALSENDLAAELGVSRTPVRESLILLGDEGLVDVYPQLGTFVSRIRLSDITAAQFIREALECAALQDAAGRASERDLTDLRRLLRAQEDSAQDGDMDEFFQLDEDFHARLMAVGGHAPAWPVVAQAKAQLDRARRLSLPLTQQLPLLIGQHRVIVDLLEARDHSRAEQSLRDHLRLVFSDVQKIRGQHPELFAEDGAGARPRRRSGA
ncbi:GntR family transcriptional regulator [Streptomyces sp. NPDC051322]|uniref:GntR family transcriptional regulator n=1 Tax=Streptomyces sp. NPDC051322 TaxID=3154645 RepID=UPI00344CD45E